MNSKIERRVTLLYTLVIFLFLTWIREIVTERAPNRRSDYKEEKPAKKHFYEAFDNVFCKLAFSWAGIGFSDNFTVKARKCDYDAKDQKTRSKRRFRDL